MDAITFSAVFIMITAVLVVAVFKFANKNGKVRTEYDERQKAIRGKAYMYAFYTEVIVQVMLMWIFLTGVELPIENYALMFIGIILGCLVLCLYCVWNDVYWGLNNDHRRYHIVFAAGLLINLAVVVMAASSGMLIQNGKIGIYILNIMVLVMLVLVYAVMLIKKIMNKQAEKEEG
jgi:hypothetical protein